MFKFIKFLSLPITIGGITYIVHDHNKNNKLLLAAENDLKLQKVLIVFRHGARTFSTDLGNTNDIPNIDPVIFDKDVFGKLLPFADIPFKLKSSDGSDPEISLVDRGYTKRGPLKGGCLTGQLTTVGQQDAYELGEWIGKTYIQQHQLVSPTFNQDELYIRSSNIARTMLSLKCVLSGMFGQESMKQDPPSVTTRCVRSEYLYPNWGACNTLSEWKRFMMAEFTNIFPHHQEVANEIHHLLNMNPEHPPLNFIVLYDIFISRKKHGFHVPEFLLERESTITKYAAQLMGKVVLGEDRVEGLRRSIGLQVNEMCKEMEERNSESMYLYSAHDTTLMALLMVLDQWEDDWPPFSASLCFEVYENLASEKYIRVLYEKEPLFLDDTDSTNQYLPLHTFLDKMKRYRVVDWENECQNQSSINNSLKKNS